MIQVADNIIITADEYQYIVGKPRQRTDKGGNEVTRIDSPRYYATLSGAVKGALADALREEVAKGTITTLQGYLSEQSRLQDELSRLLIPLDGYDMAGAG